ncbi:hypothetical protein P389DRAFT_213231 [Cystobasidium minutum MCA 4210]|uniref:uncharacterized protein n=1 Tax=Cystobasidium minutum MCA 4210 TaxID=1397322 RepID=UPI0034CF7FB7|eukprot:jgi/Rhomi1/213231/estExt_Genemark1.C_100016
MGMIRGLVSGLALSGLVTFAYEQKLYSTSSYLRNALDSLSKDMESLRIRHDVDESPSKPVVVERLPFREQVKYQWNEQVLRGTNALYQTEWSKVASSAWNATKQGVNNLKTKISETPTSS